MKESMKFVVILQNAWSGVYAGGVWPRPSWLRALHGCKTGRMLRYIFADEDDPNVWYDNTTPIVGESPDSIVPPDENHIRQILAEQQPDCVVACGRQASKAIQKIWPGRLIVMPHPAWRWATVGLFRFVRETIERNQFDRIEFKVTPSTFVVRKLPPFTPPPFTPSLEINDDPSEPRTD